MPTYFASVACLVLSCAVLLGGTFTNTGSASLECRPLSGARRRVLQATGTIIDLSCDPTDVFGIISGFANDLYTDASVGMVIPLPSSFSFPSTFELTSARESGPLRA